METPGYLAVGHVTKDLLPGGAVAAGGTALYAGTTAQRLGVQAAIVTALAPADAGLAAPAQQAGIWCHVGPSAATTTFRFEYCGESRQMYLTARAAPLGLADVPVAWRGTPILHLGPVAAELNASDPWETCCPAALLAVTPQGWLRAWDAGGAQRPAPWTTARSLLARADVLVMSAEDVGDDEEALLGYVALARLAVVTAGAGGATLYENGRPRGHVPAVPAQPVDFTGAGDVFTAAFLIRYHETGDLRRAAAFAHAAAAYGIEGQGTTGIAPRAQVEARMGGT